MKIINKDHQKWLSTMSSAPVNLEDPEIQAELKDKFISRVRPGHADLAGALKYQANDVRDILERSSARETTSRVAMGAVARALLGYFGIEIFSQVLRIGSKSISTEASSWWHGLDWTDPNSTYHQHKLNIENSELRIIENNLEADFIDHIDSCRKAGDTLGGVIEVFALGLPPGLGSHVQWDRRLDGIIAQSLMSVHTVKSVEIGMGTGVGEHWGSKVHDEIFLRNNHSSRLDLMPPTQKATAANFLRYTRYTNNLGGIEAGMSNGLPIVAKVAVKPIPTLVSKLNSIDLATKQESESHFERSDVCVVPAAGVVLESMLAFSLANAFLEKFGGDNILETERNYQGYLNSLSSR